MGGQTTKGAVNIGDVVGVLRRGWQTTKGAVNIEDRVGVSGGQITLSPIFTAPLT